MGPALDGTMLGAALEIDDGFSDGVTLGRNDGTTVGVWDGVIVGYTLGEEG